jgi:hypothetical protein
MEIKVKPIPERGERNIYCPSYSDCLDYAVECSWKSWSCSECPHKATRQSVTEWDYTRNDAPPFHDLPSPISRVVGRVSSEDDY